MGGTRPLSVKTPIRLTLLAAVSAVLVTGLASHTLLLRRDTGRARDDGAAMLAEVLATQWRADVPRSRPDIQRACERLVEHPAVLAVRVWAQSGDAVGTGAVADALLPLVDLPRRRGASDLGPAAVDLPHGLVPEVDAALRVDIDLGFHLRPDRPVRMALLLATTASLRAPQGHVWRYHVPLAAVAVLALAVGSRRLHKQVFAPITSLLDAAAGSGEPHAPPTEREDELGSIARSLAELQQDVQTWRRRAASIERRMDSQIAEQTRRITRDLLRMQREAWRDPLTGVNNRRMLDEKHPEILAAQRGAGQDLSVVMLDLDHFKRLNDTQGHVAGDRVLVFVGELLRQCIRADDVAVRYGGDEFVLILPGLSVEKALWTTNRILTLFAQRAKAMTSVRPAPTMSAGIASLLSHRPADHDELLQQADRALYEAKQAGKAQAKVFRRLERIWLPAGC